MTTLIEETMQSNNNFLPRIALIACGSFSPPTPLHFRMFEIARDHFQLHETHEVVGGIISPTHDSYGKKGLVLGKHRYGMVKLALQSSSWIRVSDWEIKQQQWTRTISVLQYHQNYMNNYINSSKRNDNQHQNESGYMPGWLPTGLLDRSDPVQLKLLCGADLLESFAVPGLWADEDIEDIVGNHGLVVITRSGANPEKFIFESDILTKYQRNITLVTNWVPNEISSTMIRRLLSRGQSVKYLLDDNVIDYIKLNGIFGSKIKYITEIKHSNIKNIYNREYMNQVNLRKIKSNANKNCDGDDVDEDNMDETDYTIKHILTSINLDNKRTNVFCCGESENVVTKLLPNRTGPGQAVQVITRQEHITTAKAVRDNNQEESKAKKMKTNFVQNV